MSLLASLKPYLCPPGSGVYTLNTARERKHQLETHYFQKTEEGARQAWEEGLTEVLAGRLPLLLGICSDTGGGILRGANWGPLFIRLALLQELQASQREPNKLFADLGDIRVIPHLLADKYLNQATLAACRQALYDDPQAPRPVSPLSITEEVVTLLGKYAPQRPILSLGGDHSVSYALVKPYLQAKKARGITCGILHFDAHTDLLHQRLGIDLCFGSWLTYVLPYLRGPAQCVQLGIRSTGKTQAHWEQSFGLRQFWARDLLGQDPQSLGGDLVRHYQSLGVEELYISFDIDALDAQVAGATGTPEPQGLELSFCLQIIETVARAIPVTGADVVEVAPFINTQNNPQEPHSTLNCSAQIAALLLQSMHGNC